MPETCEIWLSLVNSCLYYARQTGEIYRVLSCSVDFKASGIFAIQRVRQHLVNVVLFGIKDLQTYEMTVKRKSNLYVGPVNICPNIWRWI